MLYTKPKDDSTKPANIGEQPARATWRVSKTLSKYSNISDWYWARQASTSELKCNNQDDNKDTASSLQRLRKTGLPSMGISAWSRSEEIRKADRRLGERLHPRPRPIPKDRKCSLQPSCTLETEPSKPYPNTWNNDRRWCCIYQCRKWR